MGNSGTTGSGSTYGQTGSSGQGTSGSSTYGQGSTSGTGSYGSTGSGQGTAGSSTYGQGSTSGTGTYGSSASGQGTSPNMGTSGSGSGMSGSDRTSSSSANMQSVHGRVAKVDQNNNSITIDSRSGNSLTLKVDDSTQIVGNDGSASSDLSSIQEGQQVRANFDSSSNRAQRIEVMGKSKKSMRHRSSMGGSSSDSSATTGQKNNSPTPNPNDAKNPAVGSPGSSSPDNK
jgi:hypothetical protein